MKELTCIGCPRGCTLKIERDGDGWSVTGNTCPRGKEFAISEMTRQAHHLLDRAHRLPGRAGAAGARIGGHPEGRIFDVMDAIRTVTVTERIARGDVVIPNVLGLGVDVIATSSLLKHKPD